MIICLIILSIYMVLGTLIAIISRRLGIKTTQDYYVAGYRLSGFLAAMTYAATTYSAFMMVGLVGFAYATGVGALGFELLYFISTLTLLTLFSRKVWSMARERNWISPAEMLSDLYMSRTLGLLVAIIYLIALIPYISAQLIGIGSLFEGLGGGNFYVIGVIVGSIIVLLWTYIAGIWSVATTDAYQGLWMLMAASTYIIWLFLFLYPSNNVDLLEVLHILGEKGLLGLSNFWSIPVFLAFTLPWIFFAVTNPQVVQRLYMPRDEKALRRMIELFAVFGFFYTVVVVLIGLGARGLSELGTIQYIEVRDLVTPILISFAHPLLSAIIFTSIVAAAISTADSIILTLASAASRDLYLRLSSLPSEKRSLIIGYMTIVLLVIVTSLIAMIRPGFVVEMSVLSSVILLPLAPITIAAWIMPKNIINERISLYAIIGLLLGVALSLYAAIIYGPKKAFITTWLSFPISGWVLIITSIIILIGYMVESIRSKK